MTRRPKGFPRSDWFHMSQRTRRRWRLLAQGFMSGITTKAREWFTLTEPNPLLQDAPYDPSTCPIGRKWI